MQAYADMKDSGVAWLGKIPSSWPQKHARYLFRESKLLVGDRWGDYELLSLTLRGIIPRSEVEGGKNPEKYDAYQIVSDNDLVMCLFDYDVTPRTVGRVTQTGMLTGAYTNLKPYKGVSTRYYNYFFLSLDSTKELLHLCTGLRNGISKPVFFGLNLPFPNYDTQEKIADFLDTETAQIDNLIAKQERLLELLEEKRRATITHAVTRGLNPHAELKQTNIPWLGQVPQHWKLGKIYQYCTTGSGTTPNSNLGDWYTDTESGTPWVTTGELRESLIMTTKVKVTEVAIQKHSALKVYPAGTLLIAMYGATIGRLGTLGVSACTNQACCALKPSESLLNKYLYYYLLGMREQLLFLSSGGGQPNISKEKIDSFPLLLPDRTEQLEIANWLDSQEDKVDKLKQKIQTQITILRERRTSLISHAVTGKVKI